MVVLLAFLAIFGYLANVDGLTTSCVGYVKSDVPVDLSRIQVKFFTDRGNLKYETECNPTDGFYTIPVYNAGKYQIKVIAPDGWRFEESVRNIEISDDVAENACQSDINFRMYGFAISGIVRSGTASGPSGFSLALYDAKSGAVMASTTTKEGGAYEFIVKPGDYMISTEDSSAQCIDRGKVYVRVTDSPVRVSPDIQISGYNLKVMVFGESGTALPAAEVTLTSGFKLQMDNIPVNAQKPKISQEKGGKWSHSLISDTSGVAHFYCLPPGSYAVGAAWQVGSVKLNFGVPTPVNIGSATAEVMLKAASFDIEGGVDGPAIPGITISLNGQQKVVSDSKGRFKLTGLVSGRYTIAATKENYEFAPITIQLTGSADAVFPKLKIQRLAVCGSVDFDSKSAGVRLAVHNTDGSLVQGVEIDRNTKKFCTFLAPGSYELKLSKSHEYSFSPASIPLNVQDEPILNLRFTQFQATISGEVKCFDSCKNVIIQLWQNNALLSEQNSVGSFKFTDVVPSSYTVKIRDDYNFWWEKSTHAVVITDADVKNLIFQQSGYKAVVQASHPCQLKYSPISAKNSELKVELQEGDNAIFFPQSGKYSYSVADSCHKFTLTLEHAKSMPMENFIVPNAERWILSATKTQVSASIVLSKPAKGVNFRLFIKSDNGEELIVDESVVIDSTTHSFMFYVDQTSSGRKFTITPRSDKYIFKPNAATFTFTGECLKDVVKFHSEIGKVISGKIVPPVEGVKVTLYNKNDETNVLTTLTDAKGQYSVGGIWNVDEWQVTLAKEGYEFKPMDEKPFDFRSIKLSYLRIDFVDIDTSKSLSEVLVSISGPNNYRSSSVVDTSGSLVIIGLASGEYFVRPILQEYKFNATSISFKIEEGKSEKFTLYAKKFAHSAFGKITSISKQPIQEIVHVEAVSEQCNNHQEEFVTSSTSSEFRIRGLRPECPYRLILKNEVGQRLSSYPPFVDVVTGTSDKHGINFIITPAENKMTVFGKIDFSEVQQSQTSKQRGAQKQQDQAKGYRIALIQSHTGQVVKEIVMRSPASVFLIPNLEINNQNYSVGIDRSEARSHGIQPVMFDFVADSTFKYVKLAVRNERRVGEVDVSRTNCLGLVLIIIITLWFFNQSKTKVWVDKITDHVWAIINAQEAENLQLNEDRKRKAKK